MNILVLQHVIFEGPGQIIDWARIHKHNVTVLHVTDDTPWPSLDCVDLLIILGGPMSANDEESFSWLSAEKQFIQTALHQNKAILGICLGAQLIAQCLGSRIYPSQEKEIGWFPVSRCPIEIKSQNIDAYTGFPEQFVPLHWHGETFDLPPNATLLAKTDLCPHQAFQVGRKVIGLQFHLEANPESIALLAAHAATDIGAGSFQQPIETIIQQQDSRCEHIQPLLYDVLNYLSNASP